MNCVFTGAHEKGLSIDLYEMQRSLVVQRKSLDQPHSTTALAGYPKPFFRQLYDNVSEKSDNSQSNKRFDDEKPVSPTRPRGVLR